MKTILIVDDQSYIQELFSEELKDEGYGVKSVTDAGSVRGCMKDANPDLVLLDLYLNGFEGWDVLHDIKSKYPHIPVLIVTAYDSYVDDPRLSQADGYVVKSIFTLDHLKETISEILSS